MDLYNGDCLEIMDKLIADGVKVDAIITDPPYGITACKWDSVIPFPAMWERLNKLIKDNGAIVLFGSEPFSSALRMSNIENYKYDWVWNKVISGSFLNCKKMPMKSHENISVFGKKSICYFPQMSEGEKCHSVGKKLNKKADNVNVFSSYKIIEREGNLKYPKSIITFQKIHSSKCIHPTQKPVELLEYLIKTYTLENETVLDFTMGSGSTGVACVNTNRNFIGIELDKQYFDIATKRIEGSQVDNTINDKDNQDQTFELFPEGFNA